ncbi:MAG TPA: DUF5666 domain-containing protein [Actinocrinis sp.]|nr:DUF5666 domain-containing protein [Actinocrinis sp.]
MPENSGDSPLVPETDPNAMTRSFDAFTPAPYLAEPDESAGSAGPAGSAGAAASGGGLPPADPPYFAYPPAADPVAPEPPKRFRMRSVAVIGGVVLLVCGLGAGAYAVWGGSSSPAPTSSAAGAPVPGATKGGHKGRDKVQTARVTITAVDGSTLTATTAAGASITIDITPDTKFGSKARPLTADQLAVGDVVIVRGQRTGTTTYDATLITMSAGTGAPTAGATTAGSDA